MPPECAVSDSWACMRICLRDRFDDSLIVDDAFAIDNVGKQDDFPQVKAHQVSGVGGSVTVTYAAFSTALLAALDIRLIKNNIVYGTPAENPNLYGRIVAHYGNTYGVKYPGIMIFNDRPTECIEVAPNSPIELSRDVVVVPAYSFLRVDVDLSDSLTNKLVVKGKVDFFATHRCTFRKDIPGENFLIRVNLKWLHPYELEYLVEKPSKCRKISSDQQPNSALTSGISRAPSLVHCFGVPLTEVFTVMIAHKSSSALKICGKMVIQDSRMRHVVFDRNELNPESLCAENKIIPIEGPPKCLSGSGIWGMALDFWDVQGRVSIKGDISWSYSHLAPPISWYGRRLCSVSRGVQGYAAVFYTIFSEAVQALVKASFISSADVSHRIYGDIVGRYSNDEYLTKYEKTYYQSILFKKSRGNTYDLKSGSILPLLKNTVAVPIAAYLIVEVNLCASQDGLPEEDVKGIATFNLGDLDPVTRGSPVKKIDGKNCHIELSVEWSKLG
ncbi:hypothetical protein RND81_05G019300 [Saponaria officinalis]|uniref:DUF6598 domain-containing protein n=1 Tax=Saponaria officinalis TaxID=3572 RepID=A0AAW1KQ94_SAPOF